MCNYNLLDEWPERDYIVSENNNKFSIWVSPHSKEPLFPVFKVYYGFNAANHYGKSLEQAKMCRIRMDKPEYVGLEDEDLILTEELKERFIKEVSKDWKWCIELMNDAAYVCIVPDRNFMDINTPMPDYTLLKTI